MSTIRINSLEQGASDIAAPKPGKTGEGFAASLEKAIGSVSNLQEVADARSAELAQGGGNLHETALALEKADIGMRVLVKVRNKLVEAYNEVMRMSI